MAGQPVIDCAVVGAGPAGLAVSAAWGSELATDGVSGRIPGLWYVGLRWLTRRRSAILLGFPDEAATIADAVKAHLDGVWRFLIRWSTRITG